MKDDIINLNCGEIMKKTNLLVLKALIKSNNLHKYMRIFNVDDQFASIYPFTTENIKGYLDLIDVSNKNVLTVGASGDQTLNLLAKGAKSVDYFDINPFTQMYFNLKCAAIKAISLEEYLEFFSRDAFPNNPNISTSAFNEETYCKVSSYLDKVTRDFWDSLYLKKSGIEIRKSPLFSNDEESVIVLPKINDYLTEETFENLKTIFNIKDQSRFIKTDITKLPSKLLRKYDYILLSNIAQYLDKIYDKNKLQKYRTLIINLNKNLNPNGKIMVSYLYTPKDTQNGDDNWESIYNLRRVQELFKEDNLELIKFDGMYDLSRKVKSNDKDAALIYTKKN